LEGKRIVAVTHLAFARSQNTREHFGIFIRRLISRMKKISWKKLNLWVDKISFDTNNNNISAHSASAAFFVFLSIIPMLAIICALIPYTPLTEEALINGVQTLFPRTVSSFASNIISEVFIRTATILPIAILAMLWSAAKGILAIMRGLNSINDCNETRNYFILRLWASLYTVILIIVVLISLFVMVFGKLFMDLLVTEFFKYFSVVEVLVPLRFILFWGILVFIFSVLYAKIPNKRMKMRFQLPGAIFTATIWSLFSFVFSKYVEMSGAFSMYGSLTTLIIILLWLYFCMNILLLGAQFNVYIRPKMQEKYESILVKKANKRLIKRQLFEEN